MPIDISIVIVSWNCKRFLLDCIASLQGQAPNDLMEIIVVDNASSDGTPEAVHRHFPNVTLIENDANVGFARGNNIGIDRTTGRYICLINPDVIVLDNCIVRMRDYMDSKTDIGMLGPKIVKRDGTVQRSCMRTPTLWNQFCRALGLDTLTNRSRVFGGYLMNDFQYDEVRDVDVINGCFWMVRRTALNDVGNLDPRFWMYADDLDWCWRFRKAGWKIVFFPEAQAVHYGGGSSEQAPLYCYVQMQKANLQYWRKYHNLASYCCYWGLLYLAHAMRSAAFSCLYLLKSSARSRMLPKMRRHVACVSSLMGRNSVGDTRVR